MQEGGNTGSAVVVVVVVAAAFVQLFLGGGFKGGGIVYAMHAFCLQCAGVKRPGHFCTIQLSVCCAEGWVLEG